MKPLLKISYNYCAVFFTVITEIMWGDNNIFNGMFACIYRESCAFVDKTASYVQVKLT